MWRKWREAKCKRNTYKIALLIYVVDLDAKSESGEIVELDLCKHSIPALWRISHIPAFAGRGINVIFLNVIRSRLRYKVLAFVIIPHLAVVQVGCFNTGARALPLGCGRR